MPRSIDKEVRFRVMRLLEEEPHLSQRDIAARLNISLGIVNYCLRALVDKGQVKIRNFRAAGNKMRYAYILTPKGIAAKTALTGDFLRRKMAEYEALKAEINALESELAQGGAEELASGAKDGTAPAQGD